MLRQLLVASVGALALAGSAFAAELQAPSFSWTGAYVGGQIGYGWGDSDAAIGDGGYARGFTPAAVATTAAGGGTTSTAGGGNGGFTVSGGGGGGVTAPSTGGGSITTGGGGVSAGSSGGGNGGSDGTLAQSIGGGTPPAYVAADAAAPIAAASIAAAPIAAAKAAAPTAVADPGIPFIPYSYSDYNRFHGNASGVIGGAHIGYNLQIDQWVLGLEGDVDGSSLGKTVSIAPFSNYYQDYIPTSVHSNLGVQGSIRGRLGYAFDRVLLYATGGVAFGGFNATVSTSYANALFYPAFFGSDSFSNTRVGWTVGGGLEYAVTNNWSIRAEYRYTDFGSTNNVLVNSFPGFNGDFVGARIHTNLTENRVQVGFSYKFDAAAPAPVVAKY